MALKRLKVEEAVDLILRVLREAGRPLTTREVQAETEKRLVRCPEPTVVFLNRLRIKGLVNGERSREGKG